MGNRRPRGERPWEAALAPHWPRQGAPAPAAGPEVRGDPAGERCRPPLPLGPADAEDAPAGAAADEGDLRRGSLAEAVSAGLRYPEPCLSAFPQPGFCISLFPDEAVRVTARQDASSVHRCPAFCSVLLVSATVY